MADPKRTNSLYTTPGQTLGNSVFAGEHLPKECKQLIRPSKNLRTRIPFMGSAEDLADLYVKVYSGLTDCLDALEKKKEKILQDRQKQIDQFLKKLDIESREDWGQVTPKYSDMENDWHYDTIVIHHSGDSGYKTPREIERLHMDERSWDDVGYHFMVGPEGNFYEGRSLIYKGSHVGGANGRKIGILVMGDFHPQWWDFDDDELGEKQKAAVVTLIQGLKNLFPHVDKLGGHRDFKKSECPGDTLYAQLPYLRKKTELNAP